MESSHPGCREPSGLFSTRRRVAEDGPRPLGALEPSPPGSSIVVLTGRATRVPQAAGTGGIQRTITVTSRRPVGWAPVPDLVWGRSPKLHGMQGVRTVFPQLSRGLRTIHDQGPRRGPLSTPRDLLAKLHPQIVGAWVQSTGDRASLSRAGAWPPCAPTRQRGRHGAH